MKNFRQLVFAMEAKQPQLPMPHILAVAALVSDNLQYRTPGLVRQDFSNGPSAAPRRGLASASNPVLLAPASERLRTSF